MESVSVAHSGHLAGVTRVERQKQIQASGGLQILSPHASLPTLRSIAKLIDGNQSATNKHAKGAMPSVPEFREAANAKASDEEAMPSPSRVP